MKYSTNNNLLNAGLKSCEELIVILERENNYLANGDSEQLEDIAKEKLRLLSILNKCESVFSEANFSKEGKDKPGNSKKDSTNQITANEHAHFKKLLVQCQLLNRRNGYIINTSLKNSRASLAILRGQGLQENTIYSHDGKTNHILPSRPIAKI